MVVIVLPSRDGWMPGLATGGGSVAGTESAIVIGQPHCGQWLALDETLAPHISGHSISTEPDLNSARCVVTVKSTEHGGGDRIGRQTRSCYVGRDDVG